MSCTPSIRPLISAGVRGLLLAVVVVQHALPAAAQSTPDPIRYTLSFPEPQTHYVEVTAVVPTNGRPEVELMMAVWTPGSYLVREYARNVEAVTAAAQDGRALAVQKSDKNRWRIATGGAPSVEQASFDAWINYYRPNENSANASVSYYTKGVVLGFLLDARIRAATEGAKSLDDVMRVAFERFSGARGYTPEELRAVAEQVAGISLASFWGQAVEGTSELDYREALETFGLRLRPVEAPRADRPGRAWLGMSTRNDAGRLVVSQVRRGTPAYGAGLNVGDEILAMNGFRVRADQLATRFDQYKPGDKVALLVARRDQLLTLETEFGAEPARQWRVEVDPTAAGTHTQRDRWLKPQAL